MTLHRTSFVCPVSDLDRSETWPRSDAAFLNEAPGWGSEDLVRMPGEVFGMGWGLPRLRANQRLTRQRNDRRDGIAVADEVARDLEAVVVRESDGTPIEELVMQGTERECVVEFCGFVCLPPADVSGFQPDGLQLDPTVVATDGTPVLVGAEDLTG